MRVLGLGAGKGEASARLSFELSFKPCTIRGFAPFKDPLQDFPEA